MAPQVGSPVEQAAAQQFPVPAGPQTPDLQSSFSVQDPNWIGAPQAPPLQTEPLAHWPVPMQVVLQPPSRSQPKLPGQGPALPTRQVPLPSQLLGVTVASLQVPPQATFG
jgi:hypothetical protein